MLSLFLCHYLLLKLFVHIHFHAESVSVYVHFDFLCWYLAFLTSLLLSYAPLTPNKFPEIKKNVVPNPLFIFFIFGCWPLVCLAL